MQTKQQTFTVAKTSEDFLKKIEKMREILRPLVQRDIKVIKKVTGVKDVSYQDIVYLKRMIREVIFSKDPRNIQMLKCFTLHNVL